MANLRSAYAAGTTAALTGFVGETKLSAAELASSTWIYNPKVDGSLSSDGPQIGQGTARDGKADVSNLPAGTTYTNATVAKDLKIQVKITDGAVSAVQFA